MRRINWPFAAGLFLVLAVAGGAVHALHVARYGQIAADLRSQVERSQEEGRPDDAIKYAAQYLDFRPTDVGMMADLAGWLSKKPQSPKQMSGILSLYSSILRYSPDNAAVRQKAAELGMSLGEWVAAIDNLEVLLRSRPDDAELCEEYAYCLQAIGKYEESARLYERATRSDPKRVTAYVGHAAVLHQFLKQPDKALERVKEAVQANPQSGLAHAEYAEFLRMHGQFKEAADEAALAQKFPTDNDQHQQRILAITADIEQSAGHYEKSRQLFKEGYLKYPKNSRFIFNLAWQLLYEGHIDQAIAILREARERNEREKIPQDPDVLTLLGDLLAQDGQVGPLEDALRQLTEMNAPANRIQYVQARLLLRRGHWAEAVALLDRLRMAALPTPSLYRQTNLLIAQCFEQLGDAAGELDSYRRLLDNDPNAGTVRLDFARALARAGQMDESVSQFLSVISRPEVSSRAVAEATRTLADCVRSDPKSWARLEKAIDTIKIDANNPNAALARAYLDLARFRAADSIPLIDRVIRNNAKLVPIHVVRVLLAEQVFGLDRAMGALAEAEVIGGDQPDLRIVRIRLLAARMEPTYADALAALARGVEKFSADDRARVLREVIAAFRMLDDNAAVGRHLDLLAQLRPDSLAARETLFARALKAGDTARQQAILREVEGIEGPDGSTGHLLEAQRQLWQAQSGDAALVAKAVDQLAAAARGRPKDPIIEFLRGRADEIAGHPADALSHYRAAFAAGLADRNVEDLFANLLGKTGKAPVAVLRDQLPLIDQLRPDRHRALIVTVAPLYDAAGREEFITRLAAAASPVDATAQEWLGRLCARLKLNRSAEEFFRRATTAAPQSPDGWLALVAFQAARGNGPGLDAAVAELRGKLAPIDANLVIGRAFESIRKFDAAQQEYDNAVRLNPDDTRPLKLLANLAMAGGHPDEARRRLEQIVAISTPSSPEDQVWARRTLVGQLAATPSAESLGRALALLDQNKVNGQATDDDQRLRAQVLAAHKSRPLPGGATTARREAIRILEDLRKRETVRTAEDLIFLAGLYRAEGDQNGARQVRAQMASEYPTHLGCTVFLAKEALRDGDLATCERLLPALRRFGPGQFDGVGIEFQYRTLVGAADVGKRLLDDYIAAAPNVEDRPIRTVRCANLIFDFLEAHPADARSPVAAELSATAIGMYQPFAGRNSDVFQRLVTLFASQPGGTDSAIELVQQTRRTYGSEAAAAAYVQVMRHGKPDAAQREAIKRFLRDAMEKAPQSALLLLSWAEYLQLSGANADAVKVYRQALQLDPANVMALNNLAWTLSQDRGDEARVRESLLLIQRAIDVAGPLDELLDTRARILFESGRRDDGLRDMNDAVNEAPSAIRLTDYATMLKKAGKSREAEQALAAARRFTFRDTRSNYPGGTP